MSRSRHILIRIPNYYPCFHSKTSKKLNLLNIIRGGLYKTNGRIAMKDLSIPTNLVQVYSSLITTPAPWKSWMARYSLRLVLMFWTEWPVWQRLRRHWWVIMRERVTIMRERVTKIWKLNNHFPLIWFWSISYLHSPIKEVSNYCCIEVHFSNFQYWQCIYSLITRTQITLAMLSKDGSGDRPERA